MNWETIATEPVTKPPTVAIDLGAFVNENSTPGVATFASFGICN